MITQGSQADVETLLQHAGFSGRGDRAFLRITGEDATRWLNGMVTNSAQALAPGEGNYNFLLNAQGRIQGDCLIFRLTSALGAPEFLLVTDAGQIDTIQSHLDRFIIMDDVELTLAFVDEASLLLIGPEAAQHLQALGLPVPASLHLAHADSRHGPVILLAPAATLVSRFELRAPTAVINALQHDLGTAGVPQATPQVLEQLRLVEGTPKYGTDVRDRDLPQEANQPHALHFAKGCYLGQEIVERVRSRGQVHRLLTPFSLQGSLPDLPAPLETEGKSVGEITSALEVSLPSGPALLALGYARREALERGKTFTYANGVAYPRNPGSAIEAGPRTRDCIQADT